ncbi:hypothetical protein [Streptacidiphilus anmyonensis]|uniref:hypothetical protein n=1 Tax=Streptacidiphilus anmyonensis TaxID=405782 RepID=UPI0005A802A8|nr:hypothetical protein [Streptacidiphilus anmyonensis]
MSSELTVRFRVPAEGGDPVDQVYGNRPSAGLAAPASTAARVLPDGPGAFRLIPDQRGYLLPDVELEQSGPAANLVATLPARISVLDRDGMPVPAELADAVTRTWAGSTPSQVPVEGLRRIAQGTRLPTALFFPQATPTGPNGSTAPTAAPGAPGTPGTPTVNGEQRQPVSLVVNWDVSYTVTGPGTRLRAPGPVTLEFWPPGRPLPVTRAAQPDHLVLRPADRRRGDGWAAAVDFGSTASTVTLVLSRSSGGVVDRDQLTRLAAGLRALTGPPPEAPVAWKQHLSDLRGGHLDLGSVRVSGAELLTRLDEPEAATRLLLWIENTRSLSDDRSLRDWLAQRTHEIVTAAVRTPALDFHQLGPVFFRYLQGGAETAAPASELLRYETSADAVRVSRYGDDSFTLAPEGQGTLRAFKRRLLTQAVADEGADGPSAAHLTQHLFHLLIKRAEQLNHGGAPGRPPQLGTILLTYPTSAYPEYRVLLRRLVQQGLSVPDVQLTVDEGLAAGLYFVMRDLTADLDLGLEALRASSRPVPGRPGTWTRTMLVVDIGGGTTDIALLELELRDRTPRLSQAHTFVSGRDYELEPRILGTIGHRQLGGDLLTLHVFYWLKARLVDVLGQSLVLGGMPALAEGETLSALVARQVRHHRDTVVSPDVRRVLGRAVPTETRLHGRELGLDASVREAREEAFAILWNVAERVKRALGGAVDTGLETTADGTLLFPRQELSELLGKVSKGNASPPPVPLPAAELRILLQPALREVAEMAAGLVRDAFTRIEEEGTGGGAPPVLDQVVLCGRSSAMAEVRQLVGEALVEATNSDGAGPGWDPSRLATESGFLAKQATSIGAAWLYDMRARAGVFGDGGGPMAHSELAFVSRSLLSCLPCDFTLRAMAGRDAPLFASGTPYEELDAAGTLGLTSPWRRVIQVAEVRRPRHGSGPLPWGAVDIAQRAARDGCDLASPAWNFDGTPGMRFRVVVDQRLTLALEFCHGERQHLAVPDQQPAHLGSGIDLRELTDPRIRTGGGRDTIRLAGSICASPVEWGSQGFAPVDLFPAGAEDGEEEVLSYFPELFHVGAHPDPLVPPTPGRVAEFTLDQPAEHLYFYLRGSGAEAPLPLGRLPLPAGNPDVRTGRLRVTLDARGVLRAHRGALPHPQAANFTEAVDRPGWVYRVPMESRAGDYVRGWDPESGEH